MQWCQRLEADYGVDPQVWQSLDGPSFRLSSKLCLCNSLHGCFFPNSKKSKLWSSFFLSFICFANCILYLGYSKLKRAFLKFTWKSKRPRIVKMILNNKRTSGGIIIPDFKLYYRAIVIKSKTPMEGVTETKFGAETKGWTI